MFTDVNDLIEETVYGWELGVHNSGLYHHFVKYRMEIQASDQSPCRAVIAGGEACCGLDLGDPTTWSGESSETKAGIAPGRPWYHQTPSGQ